MCADGATAYRASAVALPCGILQARQWRLCWPPWELGSLGRGEEDGQGMVVTSGNVLSQGTLGFSGTMRGPT